MLAVAVAGPVAYADAHGSTEPTINSSRTWLGPTYAGSGKAGLPGVTLDCPPPQSGPSCRITVKVWSRQSLRLRKGGSRKVRLVAKVTYLLEPNRDLAGIWAAVLTGDGKKALKRFGKIKVRAHVTNVISAEHRAARDFMMTIKPGYPPGA